MDLSFFGLQNKSRSFNTTDLLSLPWKWWRMSRPDSTQARKALLLRLLNKPTNYSDYLDNYRHSVRPLSESSEKKDIIKSEVTDDSKSRLTKVKESTTTNPRVIPNRISDIVGKARRTSSMEQSSTVTTSGTIFNGTSNTSITGTENTSADPSVLLNDTDNNSGIQRSHLSEPPAASTTPMPTNNNRSNSTDRSSTMIPLAPVQLQLLSADSQLADIKESTTTVQPTESALPNLSARSAARIGAASINVGGGGVRGGGGGGGGSDDYEVLTFRYVLDEDYDWDDHDSYVHSRSLPRRRTNRRPSISKKHQQQRPVKRTALKDFRKHSLLSTGQNTKTSIIDKLVKSKNAILMFT